MNATEQLCPSSPSSSYRQRELTRTERSASTSQDREVAFPKPLEANAQSRKLSKKNSLDNQAIQMVQPCSKELVQKEEKKKESQSEGKTSQPRKKLKFAETFVVTQKAIHEEASVLNGKTRSKIVSALHGTSAQGTSVHSALKITSINNIETCKCFEYNGKFQKIIDTFQTVTRQRKFSMINATSDMMTIRKGSFGSCGCLLKLFLNDESAVYQVKICSGNRSKAKIILVEGGQEAFHDFSTEFLLRLWKNRLLKLTQSQCIEYFVLSNHKVIEGILAQHKSITKSLENPDESLSSHLEIFVMSLKRELNTLKKLTTSCSQITPGSFVEKRVQDLVYNQSKINQLYNTIYGTAFKDFAKKKININTKLTIHKIFIHLQIEDHYLNYNQHLLKNSSQRITPEKSQSGSSLPEECPYYSCVKSLNDLKQSDAPSYILQKVSIFNQRVKQCYNEYHVNQVRMGDMDDFLPITIFCVLKMTSYLNLISCVKFMLHYLNDEDDFECEKKILATMEAAVNYISQEWVLDISIEEHME